MLYCNNDYQNYDEGNLALYAGLSSR